MIDAPRRFGSRRVAVCLPLLAAMVFVGCATVLVNHPIPPKLGRIDPERLEGVWQLNQVTSTIQITHTGDSAFLVRYLDLGTALPIEKTFEASVTDAGSMYLVSAPFVIGLNWQIARLEVDDRGARLTITPIDPRRVRLAIEQGELEGEIDGTGADVEVHVSAEPEVLLAQLTSDPEFFDPAYAAEFTRPADQTDGSIAEANEGSDTLAKDQLALDSSQVSSAGAVLLVLSIVVVGILGISRYRQATLNRS